MQGKIKWYKEVLELDPNSKLFLPLARLLSSSGKISDAIKLLQQGLSRHPEYVEARIYYIELLYTDNRTIECQDQIENMTKLFTKYPTFWEAWGEYVIAKGQSKELALTLTFLAACFRDSEVNFSNIFEIGLREFMVKKSYFSSEKTSLSETNDNIDRNNFSKIYDVVSQIKDSSISLKNVNTDDNDANAEELDIETDFFKEIDASNINEIDIQLSLRTRSMADVLSEQGELKKALDIYQELLHMADSNEEKFELQNRIDELYVQLEQLENNNDAFIALNETEDEVEKVSKGLDKPEDKDKLVNLLETLADRFEERAL